MRVSLGLGMLAVCLGLPGLLGCGGTDSSKTAKVAGKVTVDNMPVPTGSIIIMADDGRRSGIGAIGEGGAYVVPDAPLGNVKIAIALPRSMSAPKPADAPELKEDPARKDLPKDLVAAMEAGAKFREKLPAAYLDPGRSPLRFTVKGGDNQHDIKLSSDGAGDGAEPMPHMPGMIPVPPMPPQ